MSNENPAGTEAAAMTRKPRGQTRRGLATREILLSSAIKLVALHGYAATTTQTVLDDAGVSRGSLLHQFPTREELMVAAAEEAMARMLAAGQSTPWQDTLYEMTGERDMDAGAMLEYFAPLKAWLDRQNAGHPVGWAVR